jgi:2,3-bisphosphoglycerate-independent phosphoglycerate mutase
LEGPDECGHRAEIANKVTAIERIDQRVLQPVVEALQQTNEDFRILVMPDHATPLSLRTHTMDPIPFLIYDSRRQAENQAQIYDESGAQQTGLLVAEGYALMDHFLERKSLSMISRQ